MEVAPLTDWRLLRRLRLAALAEAPHAFGSTLAAEQRLDDDAWRDRLAGRAWFVASKAGRPAGIAAVIAADDRPADRELVSLWVAPEARRAGAGQALVRAVVEHATAAGAAGVTLWVSDGNEPARRLYERLGFRPTGRRQPLPSDPAVGEEQLRRPCPE